MKRAVVAVAGLLAALVVLGGVTGSTAAPRRLPLGVRLVPVVAATLVCPDSSTTVGSTVTTTAVADVAGALSPPSRSSGGLSATPLTGSAASSQPVHAAPSTALRLGSRDVATAITATGTLAASLVGDEVSLTAGGRYRGLSGVRCEAPATDWWFAGADGRVGYSDILGIANPGQTAAEVSVSLWSAAGPVSPPNLGALRVPAHGEVVVPIATLAPNAATLAIHVQASSGAVTATLLDRRTSGLQPAGSDHIPATMPPSTTAVVAGFVNGPGPRDIVLANPNAVDATVSLRLVTAAGSFAPAGADHVVVPAGRTTVVGLTRPFAGVTGAVAVRSDHPVVAEGLTVATASGKLPDLQWQPASPSLAGPAGIADGTEPDGGGCYLLLSAPGAAARVRVASPNGHSAVFAVPAGRSIQVNITPVIGAGSAAAPAAFSVTPLTSSPVYGDRVLAFAGAHGALLTAEPLLGLPTPAAVPRVSENPRAAID